MEIVLKDVSKSFAETPVLEHISLTIPEDQIVVLLGPSGCGKTTLLRLLAGLETVDGGQILLDGQDLTAMPVHQRGFGFVFQDYALFPHKNVYDNVAFGLRMHHWSKEAQVERIEQVLSLVGLTGFEKREVHELSGGEKQRVALARSLAPAPQLVLLDEPLGALDRALRERLMLDLRRILKEAGQRLGQGVGMTAVYVTHDQAEAFAIADQVVVLNQGRIEQIGPPRALFRRPRTAFVARFLGMENILPAEIVQTEPLRLQTTLGEIRIAEAAWPKERALRIQRDKLLLLIRPEAARIMEGPPAADNLFTGVIRHVSFRGRYQIVTIEAAGAGSLKFEIDSARTVPAVGAEVRFLLDSRSIVPLESA